MKKRQTDSKESAKDNVFVWFCYSCVSAAVVKKKYERTVECLVIDINQSMAWRGSSKPRQGQRKAGKEGNNLHL